MRREHQPWDASLVERLDEIEIELDPCVIGAARSGIVESLQLHGFSLIRGLGAGEGRSTVAARMTELASMLGRVVAQSPRGEQVEDVCDFSNLEARDDRGYRSGGEITPHSDPTTLILLHCLKPAKSGGETHLVNVRSIHDCIERKNPELLKELYRDLPRWRVEGAYGIAEAGPDDRTSPVFTRRDERVSCLVYRPFIEMAALALGQPLEATQVAALDLFDECSHDSRLALRFLLQPGQSLLLHNRTVLHARTDYEDWPELERRRHLLRIWIDAPQLLPVAPEHELGDLFAPR